MHRVKVSLIIVLLLLSSFLFIGKAEAELGEANVYIICLDGVPGDGVDDPSSVREGALEACILKDKNIQFNVGRAHPKRDVDYPPYYEVTPCVVTGWSQYENIVKSYSEIIIVNTHGQYLPIPADYQFNKTGWVDEIANSMLNRRVTWVHVGGYPFYRVWHQQAGDGGNWTAYVDGKIVGAGFRRLMSHINMPNVDCLPPSGYENEKADLITGAARSITERWQWPNGNGEYSIDSIKHSDIGSPLKFDDFGNYLLMELFRITCGDKTYYPGAAIVFAKAGARYEGGKGADAYTHIGSRYLYYSNGNPIEDAAGNPLHDFCKGFIGTAVALWIESSGFNMKVSEKTSADSAQNACLFVSPSIVGAFDDIYEDNVLDVYLVFSIGGITQNMYQDYPVHFEWTNFIVDDIEDSYWSDVRMQADLASSREGNNSGIQLTGLHDSQADYSVAADAIIWYLGLPCLLDAFPITAMIVSGIEGIMLMGEWLQQSSTPQTVGVNGFDTNIFFTYNPRESLSVSDGKVYWEFSTFTVVRLKIPTLGKTGWRILSLSYNITASPTWMFPGPGSLSVADTLEIAVYLNSPAQDDAKSGRDTTNADPVSVILSENYHGYLGGDDNDD